MVLTAGAVCGLEDAGGGCTTASDAATELELLLELATGAVDAAACFWSSGSEGVEIGCGASVLESELEAGGALTAAGGEGLGLGSGMSPNTTSSFMTFRSSHFLCGIASSQL
jgi:hypothetical protein